MLDPEHPPMESPEERAVRDYARRHQGSVTDHPTSQRLVDYQEDRLSGEDQVEVRRHLALCRDCADDLLALDHWHQEPSRAVWRLPVPLAAGLALAALALGFWLGHSPPQTAGTADRPFLFELVPEDSPPRRSGNQEVWVPAHSDPLLARLNLGDQTVYEEVRAEVVSPTDGIVWEQDNLTRQRGGFFLVLIDRDTLDPGPYRLRLLGRADGAETELASYSFHLDHLLPE